MSRQGEKSVPIAALDYKREITVVLAVTLAGEHLPPQILYQGKTERCQFPPEWDVWHTQNHWSNEATVKRYMYADQNSDSICQQKKASVGLRRESSMSRN